MVKPLELDIPMKVLVVDDEIVQIESLRRGLRSKGYQVLHALSGEEALNLLESEGNAIGLVVTDYAMPSMNGMELLRNIRGRHGNLPVIMVSAYGQKELVNEALRNHCSSFIEKPFTLNQLIQEIDKAKVKC